MISMVMLSDLGYVRLSQNMRDSPQTEDKENTDDDTRDIRAVECG